MTIAAFNGFAFGGGHEVEADLSTLAFPTADGKEGVAAFIDIRKPAFRDRRGSRLVPDFAARLTEGQD